MFLIFCWPPAGKPENISERYEELSVFADKKFTPIIHHTYLNPFATNFHV